jgi:precorrin-6A/cobalt-precorrin-6A reductase
MILVLGGTSDTHSFLENNQNDCYISVATEYGYRTFSDKYGEKVLLIRFEEDTLKDFISAHNISEIIDTTHPFAFNITALAEMVCGELNIKYTNKMRDLELPDKFEGLFIAESFEQAVQHIKTQDFSKILLTTGSNRIELFSDFLHKCIVRVLPFEKSIAKCREFGVDYKNIVAMQGPFSEEFNIALIKETGCDVLVTKLSGKSGGFEEKVSACKKTGTKCVVILN